MRRNSPMACSWAMKSAQIAGISWGNSFCAGQGASLAESREAAAACRSWRIVARGGNSATVSVVFQQCCSLPTAQGVNLRQIKECKGILCCIHDLSMGVWQQPNDSRRQRHLPGHDRVTQTHRLISGTSGENHEKIALALCAGAALASSAAMAAQGDILARFRVINVNRTSRPPVCWPPR